ncbi:MAG: hypothetical protein NVS9B11_18240 [Candidatus Dormibacteraceae bacterium]
MTKHKTPAPFDFSRLTQEQALAVDTYREAVIVELRRQSKEGLPKDDSIPWRQAYLNIADSLEQNPNWPVVQP